jgi:leucyl aminopeptidase
MTTGKSLTFAPVLGNNRGNAPLGQEKTAARSEDPHGIYHKKRQPREAAERLRRGGRVRQPQAFAVAELIDRASNGYVSEIIRRGDMEGKLGATLLLHNVRGTLADRVLLIGLGKERDFRDKEFRSAMTSAVKLLNETGSYEAVIYLTEEKVKRREVAWRVEHAVVVAMEAVYRFDQMKSEKSEVRRPLRKLTLSVPQRSDLSAGESAAARGLAIAHGMDLARDLGNLPGNICTPKHLADSALALAQEFPDLKVTVLERKEIEALGMGAFLSVTNGTEEPPRFIVIEYHGSARKQKPLVLIAAGTWAHYS